jgi:hypothetical protein
MKISFSVRGLPPKKDGANSMWNKRTEVARIRNLRIAAVQAMNGQPPRTGPLCLRLRVYAQPSAGDLDNFITGICDGLMPAHSNTLIDAIIWGELPDGAQPHQPIAFYDDSCVTKIEAERVSSEVYEPHYDVELTWI